MLWGKVLLRADGQISRLRSEAYGETLYHRAPSQQWMKKTLRKRKSTARDAYLHILMKTNYLS